jgi:type IV pilus assembly protein PilO
MDTSILHLDKLPRSAQILVFTGLVVCLAIVTFMYYHKDLIEERDGIQAEIDKLSLSVAQGTAIESRYNQFKQELAQIEERLTVLQSILPAQKETPIVLRSVQQMAASSNLKILRFTPQPVIPRAFYSDWPIQMEVEGNYNGLGMFFEKVSRATRIIDVGTITITGSDASKDPNHTLTASCTATTFVFKEEPLATPAGAASSTKAKKEIQR